MNIATGIYTEEELLKALYNNSREVYYRYTIFNTQNQMLGYLEIEDGQVSFDSGNDVMRTFTGSTRASDLFNLTSTDFYLIPWMCLKYRNDIVKWPLGKFLVHPSENYQNNMSIINITGYDLGKIALDDKSDTRIYAAPTAVYTSLASQIAGTMYSQLDVDASVKTNPSALEWEIGTEKLKIINELLTSISYNPLYFDESGVGHMNEYVEYSERDIERVYEDSEQSIIIDGLANSTNKFEIPNKFIRYVENPDADYLISVYTNTDSASPYSTVSRGRTIVDSASIDNIATQGDLNSYVRKIAAEKMQSVETLEFTTLNMPGHGFKNCLLVAVTSYGINNKYIEVGWEMDLSRGGSMRHRCEKVVNV